MNRHYLSSSKMVRNRQQGISLIEMMIALVLGLIVVSAVLNVFVGSNRSASFSSGLQTMQENGRHGIQILQRGIRRAGFHPTGSIEPFDMAGSSASSIKVRLAAPQDCNGEPTGADGVAENTYSFSTATSQVTCTGSSASATAMPLVDGVEEFQILYGHDSTGDGFVDQYIEYDATVSPYDIKSVRFALLVSSIEPIRTRAVTQTHVVLNKEVTKSDRIARNVFTTTILLRNSR